MKKLMMTAALFTTIASTYAFADKDKYITENITLSAEQNLDITFPVGSLEIEVIDGDQLEVEIEIRPQNKGWFQSTPDLDDLTLNKHISSNKVSLTLDHDNISQVWRVKVPRTAALDIELGVGDVDIDDLINSAEVDVGVGSVTIDVLNNGYQKIDLDSGVGDTRISGFSNDVTHSRQMVSSSSALSGSGEHNINVEVGVGDARVRK